MCLQNWVLLLYKGKQTQMKWGWIQQLNRHLTIRSSFFIWWCSTWLTFREPFFHLPPLQDSPIKGVTKRGGVLQNKCQLSSCMKTAENSGGKDLRFFAPPGPMQNCFMAQAAQSSFSLAVTVCWNSSNERSSWKNKLHSGFLPKQQVVPRFLPDICETAATFSTNLGWGSSLYTWRPSCKCI